MCVCVWCVCMLFVYIYIYIYIYIYSYYSELDCHGRSKLKAELDLYNYPTKPVVKKATAVNASEFAKNYDLASLKSDVDELDIDNLETVPTDLSKL